MSTITTMTMMTTKHLCLTFSLTIYLSNSSFNYQQATTSNAPFPSPPAVIPCFQLQLREYGFAAKAAKRSPITGHLAGPMAAPQPRATKAAMPKVAGRGGGDNLFLLSDDSSGGFRPRPRHGRFWLNPEPQGLDLLQDAALRFPTDPIIAKVDASP